MGYKISWVGFLALKKQDVLELIGGLDSGTVDEANEEPFSIAEIPGDWVVLFANDFGFASEENLEKLSTHGVVVACQVHEGVMFSASYGYNRGKQMWAVQHDASKGIRDLKFSGELPPEFPNIQARLTAEQETHGGDRADVDYFFDIPVETARSLCPYRHDHWKFDWGEPVFTGVIVD